MSDVVECLPTREYVVQLEQQRDRLAVNLRAVEKELAESKRRECDAKDMEQSALEHAANWEERVLAADAEVEAAKRREAELDDKLYGLVQAHLDLGKDWVESSDLVYQLAARVKTLEDALRLAVDMNDWGASCVAKKALAAKEPKA